MANVSLCFSAVQVSSLFRHRKSVWAVFVSDGLQTAWGGISSVPFAWQKEETRLQSEWEVQTTYFPDQGCYLLQVRAKRKRPQSWMQLVAIGPDDGCTFCGHLPVSDR